MTRAPFPSADIAELAACYELAVGIDEVRLLSAEFAEASAEMVSAILDEARKFSDDVLSPLNLSMDRIGATLVEGRVRTAPGHREAWQQFVAGGWPTLDHPRALGGQQLPLSLALAVQELFDRNCPAFGMQPVPQRSAARLIAAFGDEAVKARWLPGLVDGSLGATICISEVGAGSDVVQMTTHASEDEAGRWRVTGEKCWISFGDHDLTDAILHCVLARTDRSTPERPEISLFLIEGGATGNSPVRRIEEKLGLHGSPTCALGLEGAPATLLGERGRGLQQMFVMITQMRLAVGAMGLGIASATADCALTYAEERRQGGKPGQPVAIAEHPDVQRQLLDLASRAAMLRLLTLSTANLAEIAAYHPDPEQRQSTGALVQFLLPLVKTFGAEASFDNASGAIQVLGGAGYTRDWPVEQALRDARVLAVFEGTSGIQALDLVTRRVLRDRSGFDAFLARARIVAEGTSLSSCLDLLEDAAAHVIANAEAPRDVAAGASAFLDLAIQAATGWMAGHCLSVCGDSPADQRIAALAQWWLSGLEARARAAHANPYRPGTSLDVFELVRKK
jgi:3-(methylthio)propanoyl-CoA dehydrogenase